MAGTDDLFQHLTFQRCEQDLIRMASLPRDTGQISMSRFSPSLSSLSSNHHPMMATLLRGTVKLMVLGSAFIIKISNELNVNYQCGWCNHIFHIQIVCCCPFGNSHFRCFTLSCLLFTLFRLQLVAAQGNYVWEMMKKKAFVVIWLEKK